MLKSNYTEEEVEKIQFPCIAQKEQEYSGYKCIVLFHNVTSGIVLYSTKKDEIGKYCDRINFLTYKEYKGSITITNI